MRFLILLMILAAAFAGCTDAGEDSNQPGETGTQTGSPGTAVPRDSGGNSGSSTGDSAASTGSASVYVKDAPTDEFDEIHVVFTKVEVHLTGSDNETTEETNSEDASTNQTAPEGNQTTDNGNSTAGNQTSDNNNGTHSGSGTGNSTASTMAVSSTWITIFESGEGRDIDLLNASGAKAAFLGETELEAGKYTQIRIHATEAYGVMDNQTVPISLVNGVLKVVKSFEIVNAETRLVLDFDLDKSLKQTGGPNGGWKMTPVVGKSYATVVESTESGSDVHTEGEVVELPEVSEAA